jgi:hypothetical protein
LKLPRARSRLLSPVRIPKVDTYSPDFNSEFGDDGDFNAGSNRGNRPDILCRHESVKGSSGPDAISSVLTQTSIIPNVNGIRIRGGFVCRKRMYGDDSSESLVMTA